MINAKVTFLRQLLVRAFDGSPWHSLKSALAGLDERTFMWRPEHHHGFPWMNGSIQDIVYHVTGDKLVQIDTAFGDGAITWDSLGKRVVKSDLATMSFNLSIAHKAVLDVLELQDDNSLALRVSTWGGKKMTSEEVFLMLAEHDIYHAGQIRYIRNVAERFD